MLNAIYIALHYVLLVLVLYGVAVLIAGIAGALFHPREGGADKVHLNIHVRGEPEEERRC